MHKKRVVRQLRSGGHSFSHRKTPITDHSKFCIGVPVVRTVSRAVGRSVYGHVITKFSFMVLHCARELRYKKELKITLNEYEIKMVNNTKFLGIITDEYLTWKNH